MKYINKESRNQRENLSSRSSFKNFIEILKRDQSGFSLAEVMVAAGIVGIIALASANLAGNLGSIKKRGNDFVDRFELLDAISSYVYSGKGCNDLVGQSVSSSYGAVTFPSWSYKDLSGLSSGQEVDGFTITQMRARQDLSSSLPKVTVSGVEYLKTALDLEIVLTKGSTSSNHHYNIPVLSTSAGAVSFCSQTKDAAEICNSLLGTYNAATNSCDVAESCLHKGTYKTLTCTPTPADGSDCSETYGPAEKNSYSGGFSCPSGATATQTGTINWNHTVSCGKKCTQTITNTVLWFTCLECP